MGNRTIENGLHKERSAGTPRKTWMTALSSYSFPECFFFGGTWAKKQNEGSHHYLWKLHLKYNYFKAGTCTKMFLGWDLSMYKCQPWKCKTLGSVHSTEKKIYLKGWRDGSEVKNIVCSSKCPEFNSQKPHGGSQPSVIGSCALFWPAGIHKEYCIHNK